MNPVVFLRTNYAGLRQRGIPLRLLLRPETRAMNIARIRLLPWQARG
jgi:hypothetical protein